MFARWVEGLCLDIHHHHATEDDHLWTVLERYAGPEIDLAPLSDDHAALDPVLDDIRSACTVATAGGRLEPLAERLTFLADLLDEHIAEEERDVFPVILRSGPRPEWERVEKAAQAAASGGRRGPVAQDGGAGRVEAEDRPPLQAAEVEGAPVEGRGDLAQDPEGQHAGKPTFRPNR